jgi:FlaA1/EpsC-like NDP-sugar epimerase
MKNLLIIGAGGFGREVLQYIFDINKIEKQFNILGFVDEDPELNGKEYRGIKVLGERN